jgi:integrase
MDLIDSWLSSPAKAYDEWQRTQAVGADRRLFSAQSIMQHNAMFGRFVRHLSAQGVTVATFGASHIEAFFADVDNRCAPGTTTRLRYGNLLERLCRHLVETGLRHSNPVEEMMRFAAWPQDEPVPLFLDEAADGRLQAHVQRVAGDGARAARNRAVVALLLGAGVSVAEVRHARIADLVIDPVRPHVAIPKRGARAERKVTLPPFAIPPLAAWLDAQGPRDGEDWLFPAPRGRGSLSEMLMGLIVREAFEAIGFLAPDMSPRVLRNTFGRRQILAGRTNEEVSLMLGLSSQRTAVRLRATTAGDARVE